MNADHLVLQHLSADPTRTAFLDRLFGNPEDALETAVQEVGRDLLKSAKKLAPDIIRKMSQVAKSHGVNEDYFNYVIFRDRQSWPVSGKSADALTMAKDLVLEAGRMPSMSNMQLDDDAKVDKAIKAFARWANTDLKKTLHTLLWKHAAKHAKPLIKKLRQDVSPTEMTQYLILNLVKTLGRHTLMFDNSALLSKILQLMN